MRRLLLPMIILSLLLAACGELEGQATTVSRPTIVPGQSATQAPAVQPTQAEAMPTQQTQPTEAAGTQPTTEDSTPSSADVGEWPVIFEDDPRSIGDEDAPITVVEYSDFECPYCKSFVEETKPQLFEDYVETGKVRFIYRDFPIESHRSAGVAAIAGRCAAEQDKFWEMHDLLFSTHGIEWGGVPNRDKDVMVEFATQLELDEEQFLACMQNPEVAKAVGAEMQAASQRGLSGTPTFIINGRGLVGAQPYERFVEIFDMLLGETSGNGSSETTPTPEPEK